MNMKNKTVDISFNEYKDSAMYVALAACLGPDTPHVGCYQKGLHELIDNYQGPLIYLDFNSEGRLFGIEILGE